MKRTRLNGVRVLCVDDRRDARFVIEHILQDAGALVTSLENGQQAFEVMSCSPPDQPCDFDVAVMDMQMPVMDGLTTARMLRERGYRIPILAITASTMAQQRQECLDAGCDDFLRKPIKGMQLVEAVFALTQN